MDAPDNVLVTPTAMCVSRYRVDLSSQSVSHERAQCEDLADALGGVARAVKMLANVMVEDPYHPSAPLIMNLGALSGTRVMTGLRTFFIGYSPLKCSAKGMPGLMWSTGGGNFGTKIRGLGIDEIIFSGRANRPILLRITPSQDSRGGPAAFSFLDATGLVGLPTNARIQSLFASYPHAHFAVTGISAEHWREVRYAGIALSTDNQRDSGDPKARFCARGGFGGLLGSKNLIAIVADGPNPSMGTRGLKSLNREINLGPGSAPFRDDVGGGTWRMAEVQHAVGGLPEFNFNPPGDERARRLLRPAFEADGRWAIRPEGCFLCGIKCTKSVYEHTTGRFRAKVDYEPLALLSSNLGIYDQHQTLALIALADEMCLDSISLGVTLGYAMEYNRRHPDSPIAQGLAYGDYEATALAIRAIAEGRMPELGQGTFRLALDTGELSYAQQTKGLEFPAYLANSNPGYPWAPSDGHTTMRTYMFAIQERETAVDYWVDAITNRGPLTFMDDITGLCRFAFADAEMAAEGIRAVAGIDVTGEQLRRELDRTFVRCYALEASRGFEDLDYVLPSEAHNANPVSTLPHFNTPEFFAELREKVNAELAARMARYGLAPE